MSEKAKQQSVVTAGGLLRFDVAERILLGLQLYIYVNDIQHT
jgi:hypothetical protein